MYVWQMAVIYWSEISVKYSIPAIQIMMNLTQTEKYVHLRYIGGKLSKETNFDWE